MVRVSTVGPREVLFDISTKTSPLSKGLPSVARLMLPSLSFPTPRSNRTPRPRASSLAAQTGEIGRAVTRSFQRGIKPPTSRPHSSVEGEDDALTRQSDSKVRGRRAISFGVARRRYSHEPSNALVSQLHRQDSILRGVLLVRLPHEWYDRQRYCVLDVGACSLLYYSHADDTQLDVPDGRIELMGELLPRGDHYTCHTTRGGEPIELRAHPADAMEFWIGSIAKLHKGAVEGALWLGRKRKQPKLHWAYYQPATCTLVLMKMHGELPDYREVRGRCTVEHAVKRARSFGGFKYSFACYAEEKIWELYTHKSEELAKW
ncbi:MAG: hypothetical protein SGPRY_007615 [Prymnesium sp.]